ncbi:glycoside hydrolase family 3 N-terminal domain-containing protein [Sinorhizobium sp. 8-89]|uniref:glycoside hydrolase family 3 N-terminal domain-containing protein n=1 Tax=Sinorhizobium sp. 7-81 TaxID=3049087 RepID=UPI0024C4134E|nr:glycoside hydrolase family 3 N-terminal domain-containing protein [Sinorhizobium sp. 7-81]MDK1388865.1 glycoside hydrolase family 3 N-terminal domain-containing protein [Sinorhizobium sp. 7-81]
MAKRTSRVNIAIFAAITLFASGGAYAGEAKTGAAAGDIILRQMIGQMVLVGFVGNKPDDEGYKIVLGQAAQGRITGVLYLGRNIRGLKAVKDLNERLQSKSPTPLLVAVDQEGGRIERLTKAVGFRESPSAASVAHTMEPAAAEVEYGKMAAGLASWGFNLNLGPVVDLNTNPENPIIGRLGRSYSSDEQKVSAFAKAFVDGHRRNGMLTSLKHFPGHGSSAGDTHKGIVDVTQSWSEAELAPYRDLITSGDAQMIMSSHVINRNIPGAEGTPASMSPATLVGLLRKKLKFKGVIISDDLQMGAIIKTRSFEETVRQAVLAGNDVLVFANDKHPDPTIPDRISDLLLTEARANPTILARIKESYGRVMRLKNSLYPSSSSAKVE